MKKYAGLELSTLQLIIIWTFICGIMYQQRQVFEHDGDGETAKYCLLGLVNA